MGLCQNEAEVKFQMDIDQNISPTEKAGAMRLIGLATLGEKIPIEIHYCSFTSETFWQRVTQTAPFNI